jgi:hypothetical protein
MASLAALVWSPTVSGPTLVKPISHDCGASRGTASAGVDEATGVAVGVDGALGVEVLTAALVETAGGPGC